MTVEGSAIIGDGKWRTVRTSSVTTIVGGLLGEDGWAQSREDGPPTYLPRCHFEDGRGLG